MKNLKDVIPHITLTETVYHTGAFILILIGSKLGQYLFFHWNTSPAILWPPTGLAVAILWLGGYWYAVPVFFALFISSITGPVGYLIPAVVTTPLAQVAGVLTTVYLLRRYNFDGTFSSVRNVTRFLLIIAVTCMIAPSITTLISAATGNLSVAAYISWSRSWAGYIFSCLILTPFILEWVRPDRYRVVNSIIESSVVGVLLLFSVYLLFWMHIASGFGFLIFSFFFIIHFWISFRFSTKLMTLSLFVTTIVGILGLFLSPRPDAVLNNQLFATELFLFLVVPIFYVFSALVKERSETVIELKKAMSRIERENTIKNNFISVLAHELRNPLAPVKTTLEILEQMQLDTETNMLIKQAHMQVHAMQRLLDDLLDMTRVSHGKFHLQIERVSIYDIIERSVSVTKSLFNKNQVFIRKPAYDDGVWLDIDPVRFEQALVNILNNAAKYTHAGGRIEISSFVKGTSLEIMVTDNGIGIMKENIADIFEAFWQVKSNFSSSSGGIGVGLSLTKYIVELHGGTIRAQSAGHGRGSIFTLTFPISSKNIRQQKIQEEKEDAKFPLCRILVVDDNQVAADSLSKLLTLKGHTTKTVYTGVSALASAMNFNPDIILLDIGLSDTTGYEVARGLRAQGYTNKIITLSGYGQREDKEASYTAGCNYHFTKPMPIARFEEYLNTLYQRDPL